MTAPSAAAMVVLIDQAIADKMTGGAVQSAGAGGTSMSNYSLTELWNLRSKYGQLAAAAAGENGSLQLTKVTNVETSAS